MKYSFLIFSIFLVLGSGCVSDRIQKDERLFRAVKMQMPVQIQKALKDGADPNSKDEDGTPILLHAALAREPRILAILLKAGANPSEPDRQGFTALHCAAATGDLASVKVLLDAKAVTDARTENGRTPLMEAVRMGNLGTAELLVRNGASLYAVDNDGGTIASHASTAPKNGLVVLKYLQENKIPLITKNTKMTSSPLLRSLYFEKRENSHYILSIIPSFKPDFMQPVGQIAMRLAIRNNDLDAVKMMVEKGVRLNYTLSLAFKAAEFVNIEGVMKLMARENILDRGYTPLIWAAVYGRPEIAEYLILKGADPMLRSAEGENVFSYANDIATARAIRMAIARKAKNKKNAKP